MDYHRLSCVYYRGFNLAEFAESKKIGNVFRGRLLAVPFTYQTKGEKRLIQKFHIGLAGQAGVSAALLAEILWEENKENEFYGRCQHDGKTWVYFDREKILKALPYLEKRMVSTGFSRLKQAGILLERVEKKGICGRVIWCAFTVKGKKRMEESEDEIFG